MGRLLRQQGEGQSAPGLQMADQGQAVAAVSTLSAQNAHSLARRPPFCLQGFTAGPAGVFHHLKVGKPSLVYNLLQAAGFRRRE